MKSESNILELKSAEKGCPQHLYDSLSSFSNQDEGGIIIFGIDEKQDYKEVGVYDPHDIHKKIKKNYEHMGLTTYKRTDHDEEGNPYPLLYMKRK